MAKWPVGGLFVAHDIPMEQVRFDKRETVHCGPIFGRKTYQAAGTAAAREDAVLKESGIFPEALCHFGKLLQGTRRHNLVYVDDLSALETPEGLQLTFSLPAGSYATVLLEELMKNLLADDEPQLE
jgi:tRNA pseudouridine13 synthase